MAATSNARFADPPLECDIVMKGGITSGVVYPGAVVALARRSEFSTASGYAGAAVAWSGREKLQMEGIRVP